jgi:hypothetical protein
MGRPLSRNPKLHRRPIGIAAQPELHADLSDRSGEGYPNSRVVATLASTLGSLSDVTELHLL